MPRYRHALPQLAGGTFISDGGLETTLIFHDGLDLPQFASIPLVETADGRRRLTEYFERYLALAEAHRTGFVLDAPTWRASADWGAKLGYDAASLDAVNRASIAFLVDLRNRWDSRVRPIVVAGAIGPRGDGYRAGSQSIDEARSFHAAQVASFAAGGADMIGAYTINTVEEATGIALAARDSAMPCMISFTVETDGRLAAGMSLREAIAAVDRETGAAPLYYMVNCAHPRHFMPALEAGEAWTRRILGVRANASTKSHAELDDSTSLDPGDPLDLARRYRDLTSRFPDIRILGGCCGTDHTHVVALCEAVLPRQVAAG